MNPADDDFVEQTHLLVLEGSHLFEFPIGSRDLLASGTVHHGPWDPTDCAGVLSGWLARGWLTLTVDADHAEVLGETTWWSRTSVASDPNFRDLDPRDAATLLRFPAMWLPGTPDGNVMVCASDSGEAVPYSEWSAEAERSIGAMERRESRFYRRPWDEPRGDQHDAWGTCVYYFWVLGGVVEQQVQRYDDGTTLAYDRYHREDEYGFMTTEPLEPTEWEPFSVGLATYQREVESGPMGPLNRR